MKTICMAKIKKIKSLDLLLEKTFSKISNEKMIYEIDIVNNRISSKIFKDCGIDLKNYKHIIDNYSILHIIKNHGDAIKEKKKKQLPVTIDYFKKIKSIISNPDNVYYDGKNKIGRDVIVYEKKFNDTIIYVEEIRTGKKHLATNSMRIKKAP
jgi:hypothetical protein